jgi:RNA polymerase sigma-70 factor (ECF subfamily)
MIMADDDDALMAQVAARDGASFRTLIDRHQQRPFRIGWRMLNDATEAEDVAQETLLRLWSHAGEWRAGGPGVAAWLARVATNLCLDRLRKRRFASDEAVPERADETPLADAMIDAETMRTRTIAAIQALPDRQRAAIILTYYEDQSNASAAETLEMNIKAFESLLLRARTALRGLLAEDGLVSAGDAL